MENPSSAGTRKGYGRQVSFILNRFSLRGKATVQAQWRLYCIVHNIEKIMRRSINCIGERNER